MTQAIFSSVTLLDMAKKDICQNWNRLPCSSVWSSEDDGAVVRLLGSRYGQVIQWHCVCLIEGNGGIFGIQHSCIEWFNQMSLVYQVRWNMWARYDSPYFRVGKGCAEPEQFSGHLKSQPSSWVPPLSLFWEYLLDKIITVRANRSGCFVLIY